MLSRFATLTLLFTLLLGCGADNGSDDFLYPDAPTLALEIGRKPPESIFYIVRAGSPVPYPISGNVFIQRTLEFTEPDPPFTVPFPDTHTFSIDKGRILFSREVSLYEYLNHTVDSPNPRRIRGRATNIEIEIQPWSGPGDNPYNLGKATLKYSP